jgi:tRNA threonylcarbamoyladenosine biosynthesis protein TsaE
MPQKRFQIKNIEEIMPLVRYLLEKLEFPSLILLHGNLGSGKTTLTKYLLEQLGIARNDVKSPTYSLINNFQARFKGKTISINHIDLYRLEKPDPLLLQEISQLLSEPLSLTLIEWPEKLALQSLIPDRLQLIKIDIQIEQDHTREFTVKIKQ